MPYFSLVECDGFKATWTNMIADKEFPVEAGTVLVVGCTEGFQHHGDQEVTCNKDRTFLYFIEPFCSKG